MDAVRGFLHDWRLVLLIIHVGVTAAMIVVILLQRSESLEQLRALENGIAIRVLVVDRGSFGVDTAEDLERVESILQASSRA